MYVAAPIRDQGSLIGVISLGKPGRAIEPFVQRAERYLMLYGGLALLVCLLSGVLLAGGSVAGSIGCGAMPRRWPTMNARRRRAFVATMKFATLRMLSPPCVVAWGAGAAGR